MTALERDRENLLPSASLRKVLNIYEGLALSIDATFSAVQTSTVTNIIYLYMFL